MQNKPILIVGAGPTGLILALWLKEKNISFRIIDKSTKPGETSRALAVQARTLEFYRQLGIDRKIVDAGITVYELTVRRLGKVVARAPLGAMGKSTSKFPYLLFLSQDVHEQILCDHLKQLGVEVERRTELVGVEQTDHGVEATVRGPSGDEKIKASYLCGCDGAKSPVRHLLGVDFPGGTYSQVFYVADVEAHGEMAQGGIQVSVSPEDFCIVMPIERKNSIRLTGLVPPESENKEPIQFSDVVESIERNTKLNIKKANWFSIYHVHHRVAETFRKGRIFLSGDAGHIHSPAGGQGMNTGIGDAVALAWRLNDVLQGKASPKILESYVHERMAFAHILVSSTDTAFSVIASRTFLGSIWRAYILPIFIAVLTRIPFVVRIAFRTVSQVRIQYRNSPLNEGAAGKVRAGERLPWVQFADEDNYESLKALDWQVHIYGRLSEGFKREVSRMNFTLITFPWNSDCSDKGLHQDAFYFLRPDGHVALAHSTQDVEIFKTYVAKWGLRSGTTPSSKKS